MRFHERMEILRRADPDDIVSLLWQFSDADATGNCEMSTFCITMDLRTWLLPESELLARLGLMVKRKLSFSLAKAKNEAGELTSEEAAKLLHVPRSHLNKLVDEGKLDGVRRTQGGHRRIERAAVLAYKEETKTTQKKGLNRMVEASQHMRLYDKELEELPVRRKS